MVQLETALDAEVEDEMAEIPQEDIALVQPFFRRRKYKLYACFMDATMIAIEDSPVEFEVSIGKKENSLICSNKLIITYCAMNFILRLKTLALLHHSTTLISELFRKM